MGSKDWNAFKGHKIKVFYSSISFTNPKQCLPINLLNPQCYANNVNSLIYYIGNLIFEASIFVACWPLSWTFGVCAGTIVTMLWWYYLVSQAMADAPYLCTYKHCLQCTSYISHQLHQYLPRGHGNKIIKFHGLFNDWCYWSVCECHWSCHIPLNERCPGLCRLTWT